MSHSIKIFHEAPNSIFKGVQGLTNGDYFLVHLLEENPDYYDLALQSVLAGRETILDNSIFELGEAFDSDKLMGWVHHLNPKWFIVPDVLENYEETIRNLEEFKKKYPRDSFRNKVIAVAQGSSYEDLCNCFEDLHDDPYVDMIGVSYDLSLYTQISSAQTKLGQWMWGRSIFINEYLAPKYEQGRYTKPIHLLGCALPQEGIQYHNYSWLYSIDTSHPIVYGIDRQMYSDTGTNEKSKTKLFELINVNLDDQQLNCIAHNIATFRELWNRNINA